MSYVCNLKRGLLLFLLPIALSACVTATTETGVLELTIGGLTSELEANVTVTGANSFNQALKASTKLEKLAVGNYTITAQDVVQTDTYFPNKREQNVKVKAGETATLTLTYSKQNADAGGLEVTITGLPSSTNADVVVSGSNGFSQGVTTSSVLSNLTPSDYQLTANTVTVGSDTYTPTPSSQTLSIAAGSKTDVTVTYAKQGATVGQLAITITGLPTDLNAALTVTGPNGFSETVTASQTFDNLHAGEYTITASKVDGTYPYHPYPKTQTLTVVAGESADALLAYVPTIIKGVTGDQFGSSVTVDGDFMVIGAPNHDSSCTTDDGAAYMYQRTASGEWTFLKELFPYTIRPAVCVIEPAGISNQDHFGASVAISGDTVVVGAPNALSGPCTVVTCVRGGAAYVFKRDEGGTDNFGFAYTLQPSGVFNPPSDEDRFGASVAVSKNGGTIVIGVPGSANDVDGDKTIECSGTVGDECFVGAAYIFLSDTNMSGRQLLLADDKQGGDQFGHAVATAGDTVVVSAWRDDYDANGDGNTACSKDQRECDIGSAYLFEKDQGGLDTWGQVKKLVSSDGSYRDYFGTSVAISGDMVVVGAYNKAFDLNHDGDLENEGEVGATYLFGRNQGGASAWGQVQKLVASDPTIGDSFGTSVAVLEDTVVVGAPYKSIDLDQNGTLECPSECSLGAVYVYKKNTSDFSEVKKLPASDSSSDDFFGTAVAMSGNTLAIGSPNHATVGAVYVFAP